ncbi:hypothetical protein [Pseudomonas sp. NPDC089406]|uniref:hypothetical protein n=1 Tax=Pseudomonas sp. NPDC089406 TaxID=3364463 RepID=UPI00384D031A
MVLDFRKFPTSTSPYALRTVGVSPTSNGDFPDTKNTLLKVFRKVNEQALAAAAEWKNAKSSTAQKVAQSAAQKCAVNEAQGQSRQGLEYKCATFCALLRKKLRNFMLFLPGR